MKTNLVLFFSCVFSILLIKPSHISLYTHEHKLKISDHAICCDTATQFLATLFINKFKIMLVTTITAYILRQTNRGTSKS